MPVNWVAKYREQLFTGSLHQSLKMHGCRVAQNGSVAYTSRAINLFRLNHDHHYQ